MRTTVTKATKMGTDTDRENANSWPEHMPTPLCAQQIKIEGCEHTE